MTAGHASGHLSAQVHRHGDVLLHGPLLRLCEGESEDVVADLELAVVVWGLAKPHDGAGETAAHDVRWGDEEAAVRSVEVEGRRAEPLYANEGFAGFGGDGGDLMDFEGCADLGEDDGAVGAWYGGHFAKGGGDFMRKDVLEVAR